MDAIRGGEDSYLEFKVRFSNPEKLAAGICAIANSGGGSIVFGVTDQLRLEGVAHPELIEQDLLAICKEQVIPQMWPRIDKVAFDSGLRLVVLEVDSRRAPHRTRDGHYYIRVGAAKREATGEEIAELYRGRTGARGYEDVPISESDVDLDIDEGGLWGFVNDLRGDSRGGADGYPTATLLADMRLAVPFGDALASTVAGMLLFGRGATVQRRVHGSQVVARRVTGVPPGQIVEEVEVVGNLSILHDKMVAFVERYADLWDSRPPRRASAPVSPRPYLPRVAVLEAIANALVHRDYAHPTPVRLTLTDHHLAIENPAPDVGLSRRELELGVREATNPRIKSIFLNEAYGAGTYRGGIAALLKSAAEFHRKEPARISIGVEGFRVEIPAV